MSAGELSGMSESHSSDAVASFQSIDDVGGESSIYIFEAIRKESILASSFIRDMNRNIRFTFSRVAAPHLDRQFNYHGPKVMELFDLSGWSCEQMCIEVILDRVHHLPVSPIVVGGIGSQLSTPSSVI